jgi:hypothetical protein
MPAAPRPPALVLRPSPADRARLVALTDSLAELVHGRADPDAPLTLTAALCLALRIAQEPAAVAAYRRAEAVRAAEAAQCELLAAEAALLHA